MASSQNQAYTLGVAHQVEINHSLPGPPATTCAQAATEVYGTVVTRDSMALPFTVRSVTFSDGNTRATLVTSQGSEPLTLVGSRWLYG